MAHPAVALNGDGPHDEDEEMSDRERDRVHRDIHAKLLEIHSHLPKIDEIYDEQPKIKGEVFGLRGAIADMELRLNRTMRDHEVKDELRHTEVTNQLAKKQPSVPPPAPPVEYRPNLKSISEIRDDDVTAVRDIKEKVQSARAADLTDLEKKLDERSAEVVLLMEERKALKTIADEEARKAKKFKDRLIMLLLVLAAIGAIWGLFQLAVKHADVNVPKVEAPL